MKVERKTNIYFNLDVRDVLDKIDVLDLKIFLCILYQDDVFFQYHSFNVLLVKDISIIKNESWEKKTNIYFNLDARDVLDLKIFSCILYQDDVFFQYHSFKVLLVKDISIIENESWEKKQIFILT